jgi:amino acid adenylation domain-containing protein
VLRSKTDAVETDQLESVQGLSAYYKRQILGAPALNLFLDKPRPALPAGRLVLLSADVAEDLRESLDHFSAEKQVSLSTVLLAAFQVLLLRYTAQEDFVVGCSGAAPWARGTRAARHEESGFLVRADLSGEPTFRTLLERLNATFVDTPHLELTLRQLVTELRTDSGAPPAIFQVSFSYVDSAIDGDLRRTAQQESFADVPVELHLLVEDAGKGLQFQLFYDPDLFESGSIDRALNSLQILLRGALAAPDQSVWTLPILTEDEKRRILREWNQTKTDYPAHKCLHELVEQQAVHFPDGIAVADGNSKLTYGEFNTRANQLAHYLRNCGVGLGVRVGICLEPSFDFAVAILATLKAGGACVPLDPKYPAERLAYMLRDVQAAVLITKGGILPEAVTGDGCKLLFLDEQSPLFSAEPITNPASGVSPHDIAYMIYTSGSTGKPRGVLLAHAGLVNYNLNAARMYSMGRQDRVLQFCSISFDIAVEELFTTWLSGATLVLRSEEMSLAIPDFLDWIDRQRITVLDLPTAFWHEWVRCLPELRESAPPELRLVIVGGEKASSEAYATWLRMVGCRVRWINTYGPTEASICATTFEPNIDPNSPVPENIPIGRPLANTQVYLLDRHLNPVPVGIAGELHIGGVGVALGYLNRPEMTAEKFISDPFSLDPGARLYKTGDLARYLPSGEIEFLGRRDDQVKIRGFRIELGEIEAALAKHPGVREVAVIAREVVPDEKRIAAYLVPASRKKPIVADLRAYLQQQLPDYMVPSAFVFLKALPLTPNGKVNRRELPAPEVLSPSSTSTVTASDPLQLQFVRIWQEVLGIGSIGVRDNFFELGGHSLLAARLMQRTEKLVGRPLPLAMLLRFPTIEQLAAVVVRDGWSQHWSSLVPLQPGGSQPPLFCVHGVGGNVLGFWELGRHMRPDFPFYGLQSQGLDGKDPCHERVEDMATHYLEEIGSVQPKGPYFLGGFSFGGLVAYEMAQQLRLRGEEVGLLVLFDTYPGDLNPVGTSFMKLLLKPSAQHLLRDLPKAVQKRMRRMWRGWRLPQVLQDVRNKNRIAADHYVLRPWPGKATLVRATEQSLRSSIDPQAAWNGLVDSLEVHEIPGDHNGILRAPQVDSLAGCLKACIDKARLACEQARVTSKVS